MPVPETGEPKVRQSVGGSVVMSAAAGVGTVP